MKKLFLFNKRSFSRCVRISLASLALVAMLGASFGLDTPRAQAQLTVNVNSDTSATNVGSFWQSIVNTVSTLATETYANLENIKIFSLDGIAWYVAKFALAQIQKETVNWINSGFKGSPAFVTDLGAFLQDSADKVAGEFIYGSSLNALCSPFQLNIRIALSVKYLQKDPPARCTLSGVVGNVENFLAGSFAEGGLPGWFELTVNPNNNFFGASASAESALLAKRAEKKEIDLHKLLFGKGFLGKEECVTVEDADEHGGSAESCRTVTPGDTISASLNKALGTGQDSLIEADAINEVISALFQQLAVQVLTGAGGLLGTTRSGGDYGDTRYLDRVNNPAFDRTPGQNTIGQDFIAKAIGHERQYRALYTGIASSAEAILARIRTLEALVADESDAETWTCSSMDAIRARATEIRTSALSVQSTSDRNLATLSELDAQFSTAVGEERMRIVETFINLQSGVGLHSESTNARDRLAVESIKTELSTLASELETLCHVDSRNRNDSGDSGSSE